MTNTIRRKVSRNGITFVSNGQFRFQLEPHDQKTITVICRYRYNHIGFLYFDNLLDIEEGHCLTGHVSTQDRVLYNPKGITLVRNRWMVCQFDVCLYSDFPDRLKPGNDDNFSVCKTRIIGEPKCNEFLLSNGTSLNLEGYGDRFDHQGDKPTRNIERPKLKPKFF